jgi:hypothetical protein
MLGRGSSVEKCFALIQRATAVEKCLAGPLPLRLGRLGSDAGVALYRGGGETTGHKELLGCDVGSKKIIEPAMPGSGRTPVDGSGPLQVLRCLHQGCHLALAPGAGFGFDGEDVRVEAAGALARAGRLTSRRTMLGVAVVVIAQSSSCLGPRLVQRVVFVGGHFTLSSDPRAAWPQDGRA